MRKRATLESSTDNPPRRVIDDVDLNLARTRKSVRKAIRPLDGQDAVGHAQLVEPQIVGRRAIQAIEVDVIKGKPAAAVLVNQGEGRAADFQRVDTQTLGQAADEGGLPRSQIARQE